MSQISSASSSADQGSFRAEENIKNELKVNRDVDLLVLNHKGEKQGKRNEGRKLGQLELDQSNMREYWHASIFRRGSFWLGDCNPTLKNLILIIEELRSSTKSNHLELDRYIYPLIKNVDSAEAYSKLLTVFYGFYKPLQDKLDGYLNEENVPAYGTRRKAETILKDLKVADTDNDIAICDQLPNITSLSEALGAFYVIEGSTLGGKFIADKIKENLPAQASRDFTFFDAYGENNLQMWSSFTTKLNNTDVDSTELISTATNTFDKFYSWIKGNYE